MLKNFSLRGVQWLSDLIDDNSRQYGIEVHTHLPSKEVSLESLSLDSIILHPVERKAAESLIELYGKLPDRMTLPEAFSATVQDGVIIGNSGMVATPDGYIVAETASNIGWLDDRVLNFEKIPAINSICEFTGHYKGRVVNVAQPSSGYSHHLMESLFSFLWFKDACFDLIHTADGLGRERFQEFAKCLDIPPEKIVSSAKLEVITADQVSFFGPNSFLLVRDEILSMVESTLIAPLRNNEPPSRKVYLEIGIKAPGITSRKPCNEEELHQFLLAEGYESCDPATLSLREKIRFFSEVKECIAVSGSGITNPLYFCQPSANVGTLTIESGIIRSFTPSPFVGNTVVSGINDHPIFTIYPSLCLHNKCLMDRMRLGFATCGYRFPLLQRISYSIATIPDIRIDMNRFKEWYELFSSQSRNDENRTPTQVNHLLTPPAQGLLKDSNLEGKTHLSDWMRETPIER